MDMKEKWRKWFRRDNLIVIILSGVLLFIISLPVGGEDAEAAAKQTTVSVSPAGQSGDAAMQEQYSEISAKASDCDFAEDLEEQLEGILQEMAGVGKVKVMITLKSSEELVVEKDEPVARSNTSESDSAGGNRIVTQVDSAESTVYRSSGSDSEPYVIKTLSPQVEGVVVVAQGAGNGTVNQNITEMVQALFGVEAHKVKVVKMAASK